MSSIDTLKSIGGIVDSTPVRKTIEFKIKGKSHSFDVGVTTLTVDDHERMFLSASEDEKSKTAKMISEVIFIGDNLEEPISFEDAKRLHPNIATALIKAFNEVNSEEAEKN